MLNQLPIPPEDALHGIMTHYPTDTRPDKIDLGNGVYRDATEASPITSDVAKAEVKHYHPICEWFHKKHRRCVRS